MRTKWSVVFVLNLFIGVGVLSGAPAREGGKRLATESRGPSGLSWQLHVPFERVALVVHGARGEVFRGEFEESPSFGLVDQDGNLLPDGRYTYMLTATPRMDANVRKRLQELRKSGDRQALEDLMSKLGISGGGWRQAGQFEVSSGNLSTLGETEMSADAGMGNIIGGTPDPLVFDVTGNWTLTGQLGVGTDVTSQDIDIVGIDPSIQLNDSDEVSTGWFIFGDQAGFDVRRNSDATANRVFYIDPAAPHPSLWVGSGGDLGVRTSAPALDFHAVSGDSPSLRLEQDGSGGFNPQTWDIEANESWFLARDTTNGTSPLFLETGAPSNSIRVDSAGDVGFGTSAPGAPVHIQRTVGEPNIRLETTDTAGVRFELVNSAGEWEFIAGPVGNFNFNRVGVVGNQFVFATNGNLIIQGTLSQGSSRELKTDFREFQDQEVLQKVADLPLSTWRYKNDGARHFGPMAEDFSAAFGLGPDDQHVAPSDVAGVALAAVQDLNQKLNEQLTELSATLSDKDERIAALEKDLAELKEMFAKRSTVER